MRPFGADGKRAAVQVDQYRMRPWEQTGTPWRKWRHAEGDGGADDAALVGREALVFEASRE